MGVIGAISDLVNTREDALRLLLSILAGYPLAAVYRTFFYNKTRNVQYMYFISMGVLLYLFNCGYYVYHSLLSTLICWTIVNYFPGEKISVALAHICFLGHLLLGYASSETASYDITWTTPFCAMTLRYIGLVMDVYDGHKKKNDNDKEKPSPNAIKDKPSLQEIAAYGFFFAGTLVGPQFPLKRFRDYVNGHSLSENGGVKESSIMAALRRFAAGVFYAVIHQWGLVWVPDSYFNTAEFDNLSFLWKVIWNTIWFKAVMYRYCTVWLLTEGAAILSGLAYNGKDENGEDRWDGVRDIHIIKFELGSDYTSVVESFNCGTNTFAKNHLFKRLRFLGNKFASHSLTLFYLAIWHGYHLGYFILFASEMASVIAQEQLYSLINSNPGLSKFFAQPWVRPFSWLFGRINITVSMAFYFFTFGLIKKEIWIGPLKSMYFYGYIIYFVVWPITYLVLKSLLKKPKIGSDKTPNAAKEKMMDNSGHHHKNGFIHENGTAKATKVE